MTNHTNNQTIILTLIVAIVISLGGTVIVLTKLSSISTKITGLAPSETGQVNITIRRVASLDVNDTYNIINFGSCTPPVFGDSAAVINSSMNETHLNSTTMVGCSGGNVNTVNFIRVHNIGNVNLNVTVATDSIGSSLLSSGNAYMHFKGLNASERGGCNNETNNWTLFAADNVEYELCADLDYLLGGVAVFPAVDFFIQLTVLPGS